MTSYPEDADIMNPAMTSCLSPNTINDLLRFPPIANKPAESSSKTSRRTHRCKQLSANKKHNKNNYGENNSCVLPCIAEDSNNSRDHNNSRCVGNDNSCALPSITDTNTFGNTTMATVPIAPSEMNMRIPRPPSLQQQRLSSSQRPRTMRCFKRSVVVERQQYNNLPSNSPTPSELSEKDLDPGLQFGVLPKISPGLKMPQPPKKTRPVTGIVRRGRCQPLPDINKHDEMRKYVITASKNNPPSRSARLLEKRPQQQQKQASLTKRSPVSSPVYNDDSYLEQRCNQAPSTLPNSNKNQTHSSNEVVIRCHDFWDDCGPFSEQICYSTTQDVFPSITSTVDLTQDGIQKQKGFLNLNHDQNGGSSSDDADNQSQSRISSSRVSYSQSTTSTSDNGSKSSC